MRSSNQLSLEGMPKYLEEANNILKSEQINRKDKIKIKRYRIIILTLKFFIKIMEKIMNKYRKIELGQTKNISFNRYKQQFEIK
jgi:hypothetical protein